MTKKTFTMFQFKKGKLYNKILFYIAFIVSVSILIVSILQYSYARDTSKKQISQYSIESLKQISYSAQLLSDSAQNLLSQLYLEPEISSLLNSNNPDEEKIIAVMQRLNTLKTSLNFIQSIYIYNGSNRTYYTTLSDNSISTDKDFFDTELVSMLKTSQIFRRSIPISRRILLPDVPKDERNYTSVFTFIYVDKSLAGAVDSAIVINISEQWLQGVMRNINSERTGDIIVIDETGRIISSSLNYKRVNEVEHSKYIKSIIESDNEFGELSTNISGTKSLINYVSMDILNWKFIRISPYNVFIGQLNRQLMNTALFSLFILLAGVILSLFLGRIVYRPIQTVLSKLENQLFQSKGEQSELKNSLLRKLLLSEDVDEKTIDQQLSKFGVNFCGDTEVSLLILKIDNFQEFCNRFNSADRNLMRFAILNIASELIGAFHANEAVDMYQDHVAIIWEVSKDSEIAKDSKFKDAVENIQKAVEMYLQISLTAVVSKSGGFNEELGKLYEDASELADYKFNAGEKSVIFCEYFELNPYDQYNFPQEKCKIMMDNLMLGKYEDSQQAFKEIVETSRGYSFSTIQIVLSRLIIQVSDILDQIEKNFGTSLSVYQNTFINIVNVADTVDEIYNAYNDLLGKIQSISNDKKSCKYEELTQKVLTLIQKDYLEVTLCLGSIAESLGMSSVYLGRVFKKHTSKSISDCINEIRLQKAMELLRDTNKPISEIVTNSGFANDKYFFTIFKKFNGITPAEYRSKNRRNI